MIQCAHDPQTDPVNGVSPMPTQATIRQCWENAFESTGDYVVPMESKAAATAFRAQCHRYRHKQATKIYGVAGHNIDEHHWYELEVRIEENSGTYFVVFSRTGRFELPPPNMSGAPLPWTPRAPTRPIIPDSDEYEGKPAAPTEFADDDDDSQPRKD